MAGDTAERALTTVCTLAGRIVPRVAPSAPLRVDARRILVVKHCCIGDVIMADPVLASLRASFPEAAIDLATSPWSRVAAETNPALRSILDLPPAWPREMHRLRRLFRAQRYDVCVVLDRSPIYGAAALLAGIPERCGYDSLGRGFALNRRVPVPRRVHELELALSVVEALGLPVACRTPRYHVPEGDGHRARALLESRGFRGDKRLAVIAPGGGSNPGAAMGEKRWSPLGYARVADRCVAAGLTVALVGGAGDIEIARVVHETSRAELVNLAGRTTFRELAAVLQQSALYVGNDSGTTHLAAAIGCPTVALFGPTDPARYAPRGERVAVVSAPPPPDDPGRGMVRDPWFVGRDWQARVDVDRVWTAATSLGAVS